MRDDNWIGPAPHQVKDSSHLIFAGTTLNTALHNWASYRFCSARWVGVTHQGSIGSYAVMMTRDGRVVEQTMCNWRTCSVEPENRQHAPFG